jgi:hypothetical protein
MTRGWYRRYRPAAFAFYARDLCEQLTYFTGARPRVRPLERGMDACSFSTPKRKGKRKGFARNE